MRIRDSLGDRACSGSRKEICRVPHQIVAARGALTGLMREVMEGHINSHIANPQDPGDGTREQGAGTDRNSAQL